MKVWQGTFIPSTSEFVIWTESSAGTSAKSPGEHPYTLGTEQLVEDLRLLGFAPRSSTTIALDLPSLDEAPMQSPRFGITPEQSEGMPTVIKTWTAPALTIHLSDLLGLLTVPEDEFPAGLHFDDSIRFWIEANKLLLDLLSRGHYLPSVARKSSKYHAIWQIVLTDELDRSRFKVLAESLPPLCRAVRPTQPNHQLSNGEYAPEETSERLLLSFLNATGDDLIRSIIGENSIAPANLLLSGKQTLALSFLKALCAEDSTLTGSAHELVQFESRLRRWSGSIIPLNDSEKPQLCFKLQPPRRGVGGGSLLEPGGDSGWTLDFVLQSVAEPQIILAAKDLWKGRVGNYFKDRFSPDELEEELLKSLSAAAKIFTPLAAVLDLPYPQSIELDTKNAYSFLREFAEPLEAAGFGITIPDWWRKPTSSMGLKFSVRTASQKAAKAELGLNQLLNYSWQVAIGSDLLNVDEFKQLVDQNIPLIFVRGNWIEVDPNKVNATLRFLDQLNSNSDKSGGQIKVLDALRLGFGAASDSSILPVIGFDADGWINALLDPNKAEIPLATQPPDFVGTLRHYQQEGLSWLKFLSDVGVGGCLADDMGLGKTIQLLALLVAEVESTPDIGPTLLIAPMSIIDNWINEAHRFAPTLRTHIHHGPGRLSGDAFREKANSSNLVVTTYSLAYRDEALINSIRWERIALDEAQNIKNLTAKQTQSIRRLCQSQMQNSLGSRMVQRVALTGTPLENHLEELWSIFDFLNPGYLGTLNNFRTRFAVPVERFRDQEVSARLSRLIQPFVLRRLKRDPKIIDDLPEKIEIEESIALTKEQAALYQSIINSMIPQVDAVSGIHRKGLVLTMITKLKQVCNHPALVLKDGAPLSGRSGKLARLEELLETILAEGDKVLIFTQYAQWGHLLKDHLRERFGKEVLFLHGALQKGVRTNLVETFQTKDDVQMFILSLMAGGFGLNLTAANQVIHFDQWWNPAVQQQATDRAFRIGQKRNVQVRSFVCKGTLEERIAEILNRKKDLAEQIVGSTKNALTQLSTDELRSLLELTPDLKANPVILGNEYDA